MEAPPPIDAGPTPPEKSALAIWSLALGILSLLCCSFVSGIPAVVCGHKALSRISRSAGRLTGQGMAFAGLITGYVSLALIPVIALLAVIAVPNFLQARNAAQKNICITNLRMIDAAKQEWALELKKESTETPEPKDLEPYLKRPFGSFACPAGGSYTIGSVQTSPTCSIPGHELSTSP